MSTDDNRESMNRETLAKLWRLSRLMDNAFVIPGTNIRYGLDPLLGLIPGIGDTITVAVSAYIYSFAKRAGVPGHQRMRMVWNIFVDWLVGLIPLVGDIFDVKFKANIKNIAIITKYVESQVSGASIEGDYERVA